MKPRKRWLTIVVFGALLSAVGFVALSPDSTDAPPRLTVLRHEVRYGQTGVVFRFAAPKHRRANLATLGTASAATGKEYEPVLYLEGARRRIHPVQTAQGEQFSVMLGLEAGHAQEFLVIPQSEAGPVWRLRGKVDVEDTGWRSLRTRATWCCKRISLAPWRWRTFHPQGFVESDLVTNAVPHASM